MRALRLVPALALALIVAACSSGTGAKRTVVVTETQTAAPTTTTTAPATTGVTVTGATTPSTTSPSSTASPTPTTTTTPPAPVVHVDPTKVSCHLLLTPDDVKQTLGATINTQVNLIRIAANPKIGMTGKLRCSYGAAATATEWPVVISTTKYASAAAATKQLDVTVQSEKDLGAAASTTTVQGYPAQVLLRDGGLLVMVYDNWTLAIATQAKLAPNSKLPTGLSQLASVVLTRIVKSG